MIVPPEPFENPVTEPLPNAAVQLYVELTLLGLDVKATPVEACEQIVVPKLVRLGLINTCVVLLSSLEFVSLKPVGGII